jgi:hypothetical protein
VLTGLGVNVDQVLAEPDPLDELAAARTAIRQHAATAEQAAEVLGTSTARVRQRLTDRTLSGFKRDGGAWLLPRFQFDDDAVIARRGGPVIAALPRPIGMVAIARFFTAPNELLPSDGTPGRAYLSPEEWLADGRPVEPVVDAARAFAHPG